MDILGRRVGKAGAGDETLDGDAYLRRGLEHVDVEHGLHGDQQGALSLLFFGEPFFRKKVLKGYSSCEMSSHGRSRSRLIKAPLWHLFKTKRVAWRLASRITIRHRIVDDNVDMAFVRRFSDNVYFRKVD